MPKRCSPAALALAAVAGCMAPEVERVPADTFTTIGIIKDSGRVPQSSNAIAVKFLDGVPGPAVIAAKFADEPIVVDGDDAEWAAIPASDVPIMGPAAIMGMTKEQWDTEWKGTSGYVPKHDFGVYSVRVRAAFDDEWIWFVLQWTDDSESRFASPYVYKVWPPATEPSWKADSSLGEDKAFLSFNVRNSFPEHDTRGCTAACHIEKRVGDYTAESKPFRTKMHTLNPGELVDGWTWRAALSDPLGLADDQYWIETQTLNVSGIRDDCPNPPDCTATCRDALVPVTEDPPVVDLSRNRVMDERCGVAEWVRNPLVQGIPAFMALEGVNASPLWLSSGANVPPFATPYIGDPPPAIGARIPSNRLRKPSAFRDDVRAKGRWNPETKTWTVEFGRRLVNGDSNDAQFPLLVRNASAAATTGQAVAPKFSVLKEQVLGPHCAGCHTPSLPPAITWEALVGKTSIQGAGMKYVEPGNPAASWLVVRMRAARGTAPMPIAGPLPAAQLEALETWIANGAKND